MGLSPDSSPRSTTSLIACTSLNAWLSVVNVYGFVINNDALQVTEVEALGGKWAEHFITTEIHFSVRETLTVDRNSQLI